MHELLLNLKIMFFVFNLLHKTYLIFVGILFISCEKYIHVRVSFMYEIYYYYLTNFYKINFD